MIASKTINKDIPHRDFINQKRKFLARIDGGEGAYGVLYAGLLFLWLALSILDTSIYYVTLSHINISRIAIAMLMAACGLAAHPININRSSFSLKQLGVITISLVVIVACLIVKQFWAVSAILIAFASRHFNAKWLLQIWLYSVVAIVVFVLLSCLAGVIPDYALEARSVFKRHSLGFNYTTFLSHYLLGITCCIAALKKGNLETTSVLIILFADVAVFIATDSRTSFALVLLVLAYCILKKVFRTRSNRKSFFTKALIGYSFIICAVLSAILFLSFDPESSVGSLLDRLLTNRVHLTQSAFSQYSISLIGGEVNWATPHVMEDGSSLIGYYNGDTFVHSKYFYVDCSYLNILIADGLIAFLGVLFLLTMMTHRIADEQEYSLGLMVLVIAMHAAIDPQLLMLHYNPFLLLLFKRKFMENDVLKKPCVALC